MLGFFFLLKVTLSLNCSFWTRVKKFIYSAESASTGSLAFQTRLALFGGGIGGSLVAQGQCCGEGGVFISHLFMSHQRGGWGNFVLLHRYSLCTPVPGLKACTQLLLNKSSVHRSGQIAACCFIPCSGQRGRKEGKESCWEHPADLHPLPVGLVLHWLGWVAKWMPRSYDGIKLMGDWNYGGHKLVPRWKPSLQEQAVQCPGSWED